MMKRLYHGTNEASLPHILREGLTPRDPGSPGNWTSLPSHENRVYLTDSYALFYAYETLPDPVGDARAVILQINVRALDPDNLLPDEDFLGQVLVRGAYGGKHKGRNIMEVTREVDAYEYQSEWQRSLEFLGTCAYEGTIPPHAITRVALVKFDPRIILGGHDPSIGVDNYRILGERYRSFMRWAFDGTPPVDNSLEIFADMRGEDPAAARNEYNAYWRKIWSESVEVLTAAQARERYLTPVENSAILDA